MKDPDHAERPAAFPLLFLVGGLAVADGTQNIFFVAAGTAMLAILSGRLLRSTRTGLILFALAIGLIIGARLSGEEQRIETLLAQDDRFVSLVVPVEGSWNRIATGYRLSASRFRIADEEFARPISVYLSSPPSQPGRHSHAVVEGFLRRGDSGRISLTCKSSLLVRYEGRTSGFHPRFWNRRAEEKLSELAAARPDLSRSVALAKALALGRSDELPSELREDYRRGGTYHLLVFSGMQIAFAAAALSLLARLSASLWIVDAALLLLAAIAPLFAGNEPSVTRASLMIGIYAATRLLRRPTSLENLFFVSALLRLMMRPAELVDPGFALTYAATGGLLFLGRPLAKLARTRIGAALLCGLGAEIATLPLTLFFFNQFILGASLVTFLVAPLMVLMLIVAAGACVLVFLSFEAAALMLGVLGLLDGVATAINLFFGDTLHLSRVGAAPPAAIVIGCFLAVVLLGEFRRSGVLLRVSILLLPVLISLTTPWRSRVDEPRIEFLDVGQGDAILVRDPDFTLLVDGGGRREDAEFGRRVILPKLLNRGVSRLDAVMLSHPHPDHCGGLSAVLENLEVEEFWIAPSHVREGCGADLSNQAFAQRMRVRLSRNREAMRRSSFQLQFLQARGPFKRAGLNNSSTTLLLSTDGRSFLLTGDIESEAESELAARWLRSDVLKVAHHGSRTSSTPSFLDAVSPRLAIASAGRRNAFGHPHAAVVERLRARQARVLRTDLSRDIGVVVRGGRLYVTVQIDTLGSEP